VGSNVVQGELDEQHTAPVPDGHHSLRPRQQFCSCLLANASIAITPVKSPSGEFTNLSVPVKHQKFRQLYPSHSGFLIKIILP